MQLSGVLVWFPMCIMGVTSIYTIRRKYFELFWRVHWTLALFILYFIYRHSCWKTMTMAIPLYLIDL